MDNDADDVIRADTLIDEIERVVEIVPCSVPSLASGPSGLAVDECVDIFYAVLAWVGGTPYSS